MMNERGKSDKLVQPEKSPNKVEQSTAEGMEGRGFVRDAFCWPEFPSAH
jgi:hypothetical protein